MTLGPCSAISARAGVWPALAGVPLGCCFCVRSTDWRSSASPCAPSPRAVRISWLMATVAIGIVVDNLVLFTFGKEPRGFPSPLAARPIQLAEGAGSIRFSSDPSRRLCAAGGAAPVAEDPPRHRHARGGAERGRGAAHGNRRAQGDRQPTPPPACSRASPGSLIAPLFNVSPRRNDVRAQGFRGGDHRRTRQRLARDAAGSRLGLLEAFATTMLGSGQHADPDLRFHHPHPLVLPNGILGRAGVKV